jgi:hypothetical protein
MFPAATCMQTRVRQSFHIRLQVHRTCFIAQYFYRADIATKSYRVLSAVCVVLDSGSALRQVETCGRELFKAPQRELHYGGRCTSNQWQSQLGFCLKICMLIREGHVRGIGKEGRFLAAALRRRARKGHVTKGEVDLHGCFSEDCCNKGKVAGEHLLYIVCRKARSVAESKIQSPVHVCYAVQRAILLPSQLPSCGYR